MYLHPFDAARPSMQWIYVAHVIAFISLVLVVVQVFLFPRKWTGYLGLWGIQSQVWSVFVLMAAGFMYWVFDGTASQVLAYSLAVAGMVMFAGGPMLAYGSFPALLLARCRRVAPSAEDIGDELGILMGFAFSRNLGWMSSANRPQWNPSGAVVIFGFIVIPGAIGELHPSGN